MTDKAVIVDKTGSVAVVTLNRPEVRNALNMAMCIELRAAFDALSDDATVNAVVIEGAGPSFCAGADLTERMGVDEAWVRRRRQSAFAAYAAISACTKPVIAAVHGNVIGSGGEMTMAADFAIGSSDVRFRFPEPHWGTVGATQRLQRVIGVARAKELLFTNRVVDADEAFRLGLLARMVDRNSMRDHALEVAAHVASAPTVAMQLTKRSIDLGSETDLTRGIQIEMTAIEQNLMAGDWRDGANAFAAGHRHGSN